MNPIYAELQGVAIEMIEEFGYASQIERDGAATGPAHDPRPGPATRHDCKVVETECSLTDRDQTLVLKGDKLGLISTAVAITPTTADRIVLGGKPYRFVDLQPLQPGGVVLLYEFHARI